MTVTETNLTNTTMDMQRPMDAAAVRDDAGKRGWRCKNNVTALESMSCFDRVQILTRAVFDLGR